MYIKSISVTGLYGKNEKFSLSFNKDLSILTGRNGSGKTTILKLAWFIISGNILHALREVKFDSCTVETSKYACTVTRLQNLHCTVELAIGGKVFFYEDDSSSDDDPFNVQAEDKANPKLAEIDGSIFFPTFRRIEGGFSMSSKRRSRIGGSEFGYSNVDEALSELSKELTNEGHQFVSAISTQDIVSLLTRRYANLSEKVNLFNARTSTRVIEKIKAYEESGSETQSPAEILSETREEIEKIETYRLKTMQPLTAVRELAEQLFQHSGIAFGPRLRFGQAANAINSEELSSGEKQMLSFICYNAFQSNSVIFIDEPELSLHVDWQRKLFSILESQNSNNQFIFATHSPFIYGKYPDKEVAILADRGE